MFLAFTKLADSVNVPNVDLSEATCMQKKSCPRKHFPPFELSQTEIIQGENLSERQMTVHPNIHSAANSEQFSGLQRPSKTKSDPLHLTLSGASTEEQCMAIASFLSLFSAVRQVSASLSPSGLKSSHTYRIPAFRTPNSISPCSAPHRRAHSRTQS